MPVVLPAVGIASFCFAASSARVVGSSLCLLVRLVMLLVLPAAHLESFACPSSVAARNTYGRLERIGYPARACSRLLPPAPGPAGTPRYFPPVSPPFLPPSTCFLHCTDRFIFLPFLLADPMPAQPPLVTPACCAVPAVPDLQACG